ncbi:hypothetical protein KTU01_29450 [Kocuria turfanensis]|uniref:Uncharacterized protein n=1 Tax=Kocuria turfanensis TaxID=388357 RepID=A0A512IGJ6_9MICC|nr:hypothetical protein KTU01_29450 [Kocuria turfanensis]
MGAGAALPGAAPPYPVTTPEGATPPVRIEYPSTVVEQPAASSSNTQEAAAVHHPPLAPTARRSPEGHCPAAPGHGHAAGIRRTA